MGKMVGTKSSTHNASFHFSIKANPYEVVYGQDPPIHIAYNKGCSKFNVLDQSLLVQKSILKSFKDNLAQTLNQMKQLDDKERVYGEFQVGH